VVTSCYMEVKKYRSPLPVVAGFLYASREKHSRRRRELLEENRDVKSQLEQARMQQSRQLQIAARLRDRIQTTEQERDLAKQSLNLPEDPPIGTHGYGPRMISLATNVAMAVGLRGAHRVLKMFFEWLELDQKIPSRTTIRNWLQRLGVANIQNADPSDEDYVMLVDHSCQIGKEKVLLALGVKTSQLVPGKAITHEDVEVLDIQVGSEWKTVNMEQAYETITSRHGIPRAILSDGAVELRDGAKPLKNKHPELVGLRDFKHYAANAMKSLIGKDERFKEAGSQIGKTRSAIQQTELAHLTPPRLKQKARFMNMAPTIRWMSIIAWLLATPNAAARRTIEDDRFKEKLGWVKSYVDMIPIWQECQDVLSAALTFINEQHLFEGASEGLRKAIGSLRYPTSREYAERLIAFVSEAEQHIRTDELLPMSTEILESAFGLFKQLERQHSKSGFTGLVACLPALLKPATPADVERAFQSKSAAEVKKWIQDRIPSTVTARRQAAHQEYKMAIDRATL